MSAAKGSVIFAQPSRARVAGVAVGPSLVWCGTQNLISLRKSERAPPPTMSQGCWGWFLRNVLRQDDERIPDNVRAMASSTAARCVQTPLSQSSPCLLF